MAKPETLADRVFKDSFNPKTSLVEHLDTMRSMEQLRRVLASAPKFVCDTNMSRAIAYASVEPFEKVSHDLKRSQEIMNAMRWTARLPFPAIWVEHDPRAFRDAILECKSNPKDPFGDYIADSATMTTLQTGWLLEEHPADPRMIMMTEMFYDPELGHDDTTALPYQVAYMTEDAPFPVASVDTRPGNLVMGAVSNENKRNNHVGVIYPPNFRKTFNVPWRKVYEEGTGAEYEVPEMVAEFCGTVRYAWAFLSLINSIPVIKHEVRTSKGFFAKGRIRRFLDHTTITLKVPKAVSVRTLVQRTMVSLRRRHHDVRGHWRVYIREHDPAWLAYCTGAGHNWSEPAITDDGTTRMTCKRCHSFMTWIEKHERGTRAEGTVSHDYHVTTIDN